MTPSDDQKREIIDPHVFYCIQQLTCLFVDHPSQEPSHCLRNAWVESVVVNSRNLLKFFETDKCARFRDDVIAEDFDFPARKIEMGTNVHNRVAKEVAHLTYSRIEHYLEDRREWPYHEFVPPILERSVEFIEHLFESKQVPVELGDKWRGLRELAGGVAKALRLNTDSSTAHL